MKVKIFEGKDTEQVELSMANFFAFEKEIKIYSINYSYPFIQKVVVTVFYD